MTTKSLTAQFEALHIERQRTWPAAQLEKNVAQRQALIDAYDANSHIGPGDVLPNFSLQDVTGGLITRDNLKPSGAVFVFFRFAGCPACNIALPYYQHTLWPALERAGVPLIAVSPQVPERLIDIKTRHDLGFIIASDAGNHFGNALGITFEPAEQPSPPPPGWIGEVAGTHSWALPQPTVIIVDPEGRVQFIEVSPDWLKRPESETLLAALPKVADAA